MLRAIEMAQQPEQHVEHDDRARIADMGVVIDRRATDIEPHILRIERGEVFLLPGQGVVEAKRHGTFLHDLRRRGVNWVARIRGP